MSFAFGIQRARTLYECAINPAFQVKMKLRILTKREQTRGERVLALSAELNDLKSEEKSLKVCVVYIVLQTRTLYHERACNSGEQGPHMDNRVIPR